MVRIPNSPDEWAEHVHSNGRKFLSNLTTSETRWLWTKWDMNGRLFVRNTMHPNRRVWVDEMDMSMRIESGIASPTEIQQYVTSLSQSKSNQSRIPANPQNSVSTVRNPHLRSQPFHQPHSRQPQRPLAPPFQPQPAQPEPKHHPKQNHQFQQQPTQPSSHHSRDRYAHHQQRPPVYGPKPTAQVEKRQRGTRFGMDDGVGGSRFRSAPDSSNTADIQHAPRPSVPRDGWSVQHDRNVQNLHTSSPSKHSEFISKSKKAASLKRPTLENAITTQLRLDNDTPKRRRIGSVRRTSPPTLFSLRSLSQAPRAIRRLHSSFISVPHHHIFKRVYEDRVRGSSAPEGSASTFDLDADDRYMHEPIVGTCEEIEKEYLRLTSAPKPEAVRPPRVLRLSLAHIKSIWTDGTRGYGWVCRQLKSIRQDYTVQAITDRDVVDVYKTHARLAIENGDLGEFNTCVAQLQRLFDKVDCPREEHDEFAAYRILYSVITSAKAWQVQREFARLSPAQRQWTAVHFAWQICLAIKRDNYHDYFRHASCPPKHTVAHFLLVYLDRRMRHLAMRAMIAAYGPGQPGLLPLTFVATELGWAPRGPAKVFREYSVSKLPEQVVGTNDQSLLGVFRKLGLVRESAWVFQALEFLVSINVDLVVDEARAAPNAGSTRVNSVFVDCKATKSHGVGELKTNGKLITHAGSMSR